MEITKEATTIRIPVSNDVQRAIDGLKEIPDEELQKFLNEEDFMKDLDVVDAWEGGMDDVGTKKESRSSRMQDTDAKRSREHHRREHRSPYGRDHHLRKEDTRRDPSKSSKDIERDKIRTKKDTDSKMLAEKEKAIKNLLESGDVVPPGTEEEAIQMITENADRDHRARRSRDRQKSLGRRRSNDRQPRMSPDRRRILVSPPLRRSWERQASRDRSIERRRRREDREKRRVSRRSRSRDRQRSRSSDRYRKRWSRSPLGRRSSPRRRSRTRSRTRSRSPERRPTRKRSPFINELARTFRNEGLIPGGNTNFLPGIPPLVGPRFTHAQPNTDQPPSFVHQGPPPGPPQMHMQPGLPFHGFPEPPTPQMPPGINFDPNRGPMMLHQTEYAAPPVMYNQPNPLGAIQGSNLSLSMSMPSPQPVPAPITPSHSPMNFNPPHCPSKIPNPTIQQQQSPLENRASPPRTNFTKESGQKAPSLNGIPTHRPERVKTPEPPIISNSKRFEKTSLSSLLEASVSAKDSVGPPVLYPGFKPEILRRCEIALRNLPTEDQRLRMKGRFFFDPYKEDPHHETVEPPSNSILLRAAGAKIYWEESTPGGFSLSKEESSELCESRRSIETHPKFTQTEPTTVETVSQGVQACFRPSTSDFCVQVSPSDLHLTAKEEKRPIMDRLDWNVRSEDFEYSSQIRESDDLRWSLSNSSQKRPWNSARATVLSPPRVHGDQDRNHSPGRLLPPSSDLAPRDMNVIGTSTRNTRDNYHFHRSSSREDRYPSARGNYRGSVERVIDEFRESRGSDHSRDAESPLPQVEDSPDEVEILNEERSYSTNRGGSDWRHQWRGSHSFKPSNVMQKHRIHRGKTSGRPYSGGRGGYRGQF